MHKRLFSWLWDAQCSRLGLWLTFSCRENNVDTLCSKYMTLCKYKHMLMQIYVRCSQPTMLTAIHDEKPAVKMTDVQGDYDLLSNTGCHDFQHGHCPALTVRATDSESMGHKCDRDAANLSSNEHSCTRGTKKAWDNLPTVFCWAKLPAACSTAALVKVEIPGLVMF